MMIWLYRLFFPLLLVVALPWYLWRMRQRSGHRGGTAQRLGLKLDPPPRRSDRLRIWVQAVSVGEVGAVEALLRELARDGRYEFVLTATTSTGRALAHKRLADVCAWIGWFPLDLAPCNRRFWNRLQPDAAFLMEGELWPEHLHQARRRGVPVYLINARLSDRSFARFRRVGKPARSLSLDHLTMVLAASPRDAERWRRLVPGVRIEQTGNLKLDLPAVDAAERTIQRKQLLAAFGFTGSSGDATTVLFGNSTWPGEEALLLDAWQRAVDAGVPCRVVLVPRHAERREEIRSLLAARKIAHHFRSEGASAPAGTQCYIGDTTGELVRLLPAADVVFVGKSLPPHEGGQNPIEAVSFGLPVVFGPRMSNFREVADGLVAEGVARVGSDAEECASILLDLLREPELRVQTADAAEKWLARRRGALRRTADLLRAELSPQPE